MNEEVDDDCVRETLKEGKKKGRKETKIISIHFLFFGLV